MSFPITQIHPTLNHQLARLDAVESAVGPLKRGVVPGLGAVVGLGAMAYNYTHAPTPEQKRKSLIRDGFVLAGVVLSTALTARALGRNHGKLPLELGYKLEKFTETGLNQLKVAWTRLRHGKAAAEARGKELAHDLEHALEHRLDKIKNLGKEASHDHACHHHGPGDGGPLGRVKQFFSSSLHSHGYSAAVNLTLEALGAITGGAVAGIAADAINGEEVKKTAPMKLKEGLFQFLGNITMCTIAILALSQAGRKGFNLMWEKFPALQQWAKKNTQAKLENLAKAEFNDLRLVPSHVSEEVEGTLLAHKDDPKAALKKIKDFLHEHFEDRWHGGGGHHHGHNHSHDTHKATQKATSALEHAWEKTLQPKLEKLLNPGEGKKVNHKDVHQAVREFYAQQIQPDITAVAHSSDDLTTVAQQGFTRNGELLGVVGGIVAGVVGGAWVSNTINSTMGKIFDFPEGHISNGFFGKESAHHRGWLNDQVGDRGIQWYDTILHFDDYPAVLYMAGVHAVESLIQFLYGISGFLTGTAGTDYLTDPSSNQTNTPRPSPPSPTQQGAWPANNRFNPNQPFIYQLNPNASQQESGSPYDIPYGGWS